MFSAGAVLAAADSGKRESFSLRGVANLDRHLGKAVGEIKLAGLNWTQASVVRRELLIERGQPLSESALSESVQRLRNLKIFRLVDAQLEAMAKGRVRVLLRFDEKWTTMPIVGFSRRAALFDFTLGLSDRNLLGRLLELRGFYYNFAGTHSGVVQFADPRFLDRRLRLGVAAEAGNMNRVVRDRLGDPHGAYSRHRRAISAEVINERTPHFRYGLFAGLYHDRYSEGLLNDEQLAMNAASRYQLPDPVRVVLLRGSLHLGRINYEDYLESGGLLELHLSGASEWLGSTADFARLYVSGRLSTRFPSRQNLILRFSLGTMSNKVTEHVFFVGGLAHVRGLLHGQFRGMRMFNTNLEYRVPSMHRRWLVLQHVVFADAGDAADDMAALVRPDALPPFSVGTGLRLLLPKLGGFLARLDLAVAFYDRVDYRISFGSQQFF